MNNPADHDYDPKDYIEMQTFVSERIKKLETKIREWEDHHMEWNFQDSCSDKKINELHKALEKFGRHTMGCYLTTNTGSFPLEADDCDCGLYKALS